MPAAASACCARRCSARFRARNTRASNTANTCASASAGRRVRSRTGRADPFDLVVCYDVLQYLDDRTAARAIANLGRLTRGVLYLSALTARDWRENCDRTRTDRDVSPARRRVVRHAAATHFRPSGVGFWIRRGAPLTTWEMETAAI